VVYDTVLHCWASGSNISKDHGALIFRVKQPKKKNLAAFVGLFNPEDEGTMILGNQWPNNTHQLPEYSIYQQHICEDLRDHILVSVYKITWCTSHEDSTLNTHCHTIRVS